jgi:Na+/proline symporter
VTPLDLWIVAGYLVATLAVGIALARRASGSLEDFFVGGRSLPWWLAGTSMAATTFSIDTPLYVAGVVGTRGIAGNWEWWSFGVAHVVLLYVFARLWRRAEVVTDNELSELRYGGRPAALLRGVKGFLFAGVLGPITMGLSMLAMVKVIDALGVLPALGLSGAQDRLWVVTGVSVLVLVYSGISGLWGVVVTDFVQFVLGMAGALLVAFAAVSHLGGLDGLVTAAAAVEGRDLLAFTPLTWEDGGRVVWSSLAGISASTFFAYVGLQWWAFRRSDGGGEFVQRLAAAKTEAEAQKAAWLFNLLHYVIRTWPWIIVALAAVVLYPDMADPELGYPRLMLDFLPAGHPRPLYPVLATRRFDVGTSGRCPSRLGPGHGAGGCGGLLQRKRHHVVPVDYRRRDGTGAGLDPSLVLVAGERVGRAVCDGGGVPGRTRDVGGAGAHHLRLRLPLVCHRSRHDGGVGTGHAPHGP